MIAAALFIIFAGVTALGNTYTVTKTSMGGSSAGRLDTAINNANSNPGPDTIAFDIPTSDGGYDAARGVWRFSLSASLPNITGDTTIDGATQTINRGNTNTFVHGTGGTVGVDGLTLSQVPGPEIEITATSAITIFQVTTGALTLKGFAFYKADTVVHFSTMTGLGSTLEACVFGLRANSASSPSPDLLNQITSGGQNPITVNNSVLAYTVYPPISESYVSLTFTNNEVSMMGSSISLNGGVATIRGNYFHDIDSAAIQGPAVFTAENNTIERCGLAAAEISGVRAEFSAGSVIDRNLIRDNYGAGVSVVSSTTARITKNSIHGNGTITGEVGIDLTSGGDPATPYYTRNDSGDGDTGGNGLLNFPVITSATLSGGNLTLTGYARPGSVIELFIADPDASGFGEGKTYLTTLTEGSGADTDTTTGTYSGLINGIDQGTDTTNRFSFTVATPPGVTTDTKLTATATVSNCTSEFSGNVTVTEAYTISGHIQNASAVAISGVTVTLSGGQAGSTITDASGNFSFAGLPATDNYTVTPSLANYTFAPTSLTYNNLSANQTTADFTATSTITHTISGHIQNASAVSVSGVTVTLSGDQAGSTTTDSSGNYSFANLTEGGNYTVTPSKTDYTFTPASLTYNNLSANQPTASFTGTSTITYNISGHIQNASAIAISGVTVTLSGGQSGTTTTDSSGNYSFTGLPSTNNYTVTPSKTDYTFAPTSLTYNNLSANQTTADFIGTSTITYTISGFIRNGSSIGVSGVTVTLSGGQSGATTTASNGNYSFTGLPSTNNYTVTPSKTDYTFAPTSLTYNNLSANQTTANFTGTSTITYTISGHIQNASGISISGVTVTLSGGQTGSAITDASGNYSFTGLPSTNNYTVTPSKTNYTFSPASRTYNNLSADQTAADFTGTSTITYSIIGRIKNASAVSISGVTVTLSGGQSGSTTTDESGNYSFFGLPSTNNYTVTPTKTDYTFTPTSLTYNNLSANQNTAHFTGTSTITYTISGHIQNASGIAISGATVALSNGQSASTTTDASGNYSFTGLPSTNNYNLSASLANYTFSPPGRSYFNLSANQTTADFTGTSNITHNISGHIQNASAVPISGVTVTLSGGQSGSTTTDQNGNYSFSGLPSTNNYTVTPSKTDYTFSPTSLTYNNLSANQTTANFTGTVPTYTLSGHIQNASAVPISGVTVTLSGGQTGSTTTDASGNYAFTGLPVNNNYTLTPSKTHYTFSPASLTYNSLSADQTGANFTGTLPTYTIDGPVLNFFTGVGVGGITITLSGSATASATTDANGLFSFPNLDAGGNYTVTPSKAGYTFFPNQVSFSDLSGDRLAEFETQAHLISGVVTVSGTPLSGVTITLSGGQTGTASTDASGSYSFPDLPHGGNYTVTPSKAGYTFAPTSLTYNNLTADQTTADFTGALAGLTISGHIQTASAVAIVGVTVTLSGGQSGTTTTDASGNYSFAGLASGFNYTVTPSKTDYAFSPPSLTFNNLSAAQVADFTGALMPNITLTASVNPTGTVEPGTDLLYTIDFTNGGAGFASAFVITDPIPANSDFKIGSANTDLMTTGLSVLVSYSNDGGSSWTYTPLSGAGGAPAGYDRLVTHVRWTFTGSLSQAAPNNTGAVFFTVRIK